MQLKNRLFPYPILNHNKVSSSFNNFDFLLSYGAEETNESYILRNAKFVTESNFILKLYHEGKIKIFVIVECSKTVYRKAFEITEIGSDIVLSKVDFTERVDISLFAFATDQLNFHSNEFAEDFCGIDFEIDKYDIVAANDGFNIRFIHDESEDNLAQSIFSIVNSDKLTDGVFIVDSDITASKKILISLSENDYKNYKIIYSQPPYKEVFFNMLLVPALIESLFLCKNYLDANSSRDLDDVGDNYNWFRSIIYSYKRLKGVDLTIEEFRKVSAVVLAQELLAKPLGESFKNLLEVNNRENIENEYN